jgi:hypothetical protein
MLSITKSRFAGRNLDFRKYCLIIVSLVLFQMTSTLAQTNISAGEVSGTWLKANSPYHINGEVTIPSDSTLTIEPGVEVVFMGHYKFNVQGRLLAIGTQTDSIKFTTEDKETGWHGIRFNQTPNTNDTSKIVYCSFKYGNANTGSGLDRCGGAIMISRFDKVLVINCSFEFNMNSGDTFTTGGAAIYIEWASPIIKNNTFSNNTGTTDCAIRSDYRNAMISNNIFSNNRGPHGPILCAYNTPIISGNIITNNVTTRAGGGIFTMTSNAIITNNIIINNQSFGMEGEGGGIKCWINDKSIIINNTIAYNSATHGGGICCNDNSDPIFINNIIWGNTSTDGDQVNFMDINSDPHFSFCNIQGGKEGFGGNGAGASYFGLYESNIDFDPLFKDTTSIDYSLSNSSLCIGAGIESILVEGVWYYAPPFDIEGKPRPSPVGSNPDIGAYENGTPVGVEQELTNPTDFILYQNYPNPFNPSTTIQYSIPQDGLITLKIYDVLGKELKTLVNENKSTGRYEVKFDASSLASGVYLYQLKVNDFIETKMMMLMK